MLEMSNVLFLVAVSPLILVVAVMMTVIISDTLQNLGWKKMLILAGIVVALIAWILGFMYLSSII
jgi:succinate dehydrogenase hydrophobic anchor subunit